MRRLVIAFVAVFSLVSLSACTDDTPESGSRSGSTEAVGEDRGVELAEDDFVEEISSAQLEAGTVQVTTTTSIGGQELVLEGYSALAKDPDEKAAVLSMDVSALGMAGDEPMDLRMVDQKVYVNLGETTDGKFYRVDLAQEDDPMGAELAGMLEQADPLRQFEVLGAAATEISSEGDGGEIDGVATTRYVLSVDPAAMYEAQGFGVDEGMPEAFDYILYVGVDHLPRRMEIEVPGAGTSTVEWSEWGQDVVIDVPDDDQITDEAPAA
ncbi:hypothetical protein JL108_08670 [Aeromicrobium sp. YIM 150415]|uniref:hypothetical protein n=1 Tax=Aeromicrobium sp. YIM 150415 TaxID=2803912 RepID=UPI001964CB3E|nr:hypothetical protein [Aeromicrobium sp. YIM 150415]MBM9463523.1 hypothetical protein [Aeromicrobium sp. YIM 150415]